MPGESIVHQEAGDAAVLGHVRVGAGQQDPPVGVVRRRGPHLLTGDDPLVAVEDRPGRQPGEVGAGTGLAEELAPDVVRVRGSAARNSRLLVLGAPLDDGRAGHADADAEHVPGHVVALLLGGEDAREQRRQAHAAVLDGPVRRRPTDRGLGAAARTGRPRAAPGPAPRCGPGGCACSSSDVVVDASGVLVEPGAGLVLVVLALPGCRRSPCRPECCRAAAGNCNLF